MHTNIVLGSGPSGVAAAHALIRRGLRVLMLDVGNEMEEMSSKLRDRVAARSPESWSLEDRSDIVARRQSQTADSISPFGSDVVFRQPPGVGDWRDVTEVTALRPSFARGGLSNGWGASVTPYRSGDIASWPIGLQELRPHYDAVSGLLGVSARRDGLADFFPEHDISRARSLRLSSQAERILRNMDRNQSKLAELGVSFGQSRQAIREEACHLCAMCLHGCPYGAIFNAADAVDRLLATGALTYKPGVYATRVEESVDAVTVHSAAGEFRGNRLFVGCGVLPTALLMLRSLRAGDRVVTLKDSQYFFLPMLQPWSVSDPSAEPRHSLAQLFWELVHSSVDEHTVHAQLYTYNDTYAPDMRRKFGRLSVALEPLIHLLSRRLVVAQGFLHSDVSPAIGLRLKGPAGREVLEYSAIGNERAAGAVARARQGLVRVARLSGLYPLSVLSRTGALGGSFHCGGSFPMALAPGPLQTDTLGRPAGMNRVHLVDASVFPSIPATTITFSVMANAHRIASQA